MKSLLALIAAATIPCFFGSCERHSWEDSKVLFEEHGAAHGKHGEHGDHNHSGEGDHGGHDEHNSAGDDHNGGHNEGTNGEPEGGDTQNEPES